MPVSALNAGNRRSKLRWTQTLSFLKWVSLLFVGYYLGSLHSSFYYASSHHELRHPLQQHEGFGERSESALNRERTALKSREEAELKEQNVEEGGSEDEDQSEDEEDESVGGLSSVPRHGICQRLATPSSSGVVPSAAELWFRYYVQVHKASQLSTKDTNYKFSDFTADLLHLVAPRLPHSTGMLPRDWSLVKRILEKAEKRLLYLQNPKQYAASYPNDPSIPDPVKIVILGGSVLVGRNCRKLIRDLGKNLGFQMPNRECTYSFRLQIFLDQITHLIFHPNEPMPMGEQAKKSIGQLFLVTKVALGGTNTNVGSQIFKYDLIPEEARQSDIVLNSYATNDMHILTILEMEAQKMTLREGIFDMLQNFVRTIMRPNSCRKKGTAGVELDNRPLLLHFDDYLGNEQREILRTLDLSQSVSALAQYYGFGTMSYANVVRDWVYGDTHEYWFSPEGWWQVQPDARKPPTIMNTMQREIHPGMGMHIAATWIVAYNLLHIASSYCSLEPFLADGSNSMLEPYVKSSWAKDLVAIQGELLEAPGRPRRPPPGLPPKLTQHTVLDDISEQWRNQTVADVGVCEDNVHPKCPFSWVSGLSLQQNNKTWISEFFGARTVTVSDSSQAWPLVDEGGKIGFMAHGPDSRWILEFPNLRQPISTVTIFYLRSYGDKWKDSRASISALVWNEKNEWRPLSEDLLLEGTHAKNTSEMYTGEISFSPLTIGQKLRVVCALKEGSTFKVMGLAICQ